MEALQIFSYNETPVTFKNENGVVFISATEMAKPFQRRPNDYLNLPTTKSLVDAITRKNGNCDYQLVMSKQGSVDNGGGTWLHEDIALDFAQWLNIDFKLWCNDRIKELLNTGVTTITNDDDVIAQAMSVLQKRLEASRQEKEQLQVQNDLQKQAIKAIAPKAEYYDEVLQSTETYVITRIATDLGLSAIAMNKKLANLKIQRKVDGQWVLYAKYVGNGYTKSHTTTYTKSNGETGTNTQTVWTEQGRAFLHNLLKSS